METQMIIEFILNWYGILFAVLFIATKLLLDYEKAKELILEYIIDLEKDLESNMNEKIHYIVEQVYPDLPKLLRLFLTKAQFRDLVEFFYEKLIMYREDQK